MPNRVDMYDAYPHVVIRDGLHNRAANAIVLSTGTILLVYQSGTDENGETSINIRQSSDGLTYSDVIGTVTEAPTYNMKGANILELPNGNILMVYNRVLPDPVTRNGIYYRISTDGGATWSSATEIETSKGTDAAIGGPPILLDNGDIIQPCWAGGGGYIDSFMMRSTDNGATWSGETMIGDGSADEKYYYEPCLCELANGNLLCLIREEAADSCYKSVSTDGGATWTTPDLAFADNQSAVRFIQLSTGDLFAVFRRGTGAGETQYRVSGDNGTTWGDAVYILADSHNCTYGGAVEVGNQVIAVYGVKWTDTDGAIHVSPFDVGAL